ncbi:MAG: ATP-binding protein [Leptolyngbyaceae cyanobacterium]
MGKPLQDKPADFLTLAIAFQSLLKRHQTTCLLVNRQNQLMYVCGDGLNLLKAIDSVEPYQDILGLFPDSLKAPVSKALDQAHQNSEALQAVHWRSLIDHQLYPVKITASLHNGYEIKNFGAISQDDSDCSGLNRKDAQSLDLRSQDFFSLVIERASKNSHNPVECHTTELLTINEHLRAKVLEQQQFEQQLVGQTQALARSNANLEEFAYVVSHDLQEPLRAVTAFSQLLEQRYHHQLDESAKRYITHIVEGGTRMKAMIDGILELSRINRQRHVLQGPTNLEAVLKNVLENLKLLLVETQATITYDTLPSLYIDVNHITQLLQNLIGNAIKFRGAKPPRIHITAQQQPNSWIFSVQDNGIGIPENQQKRIFKLFQRLHNQREYQGYGIGLAICKKIVEHYQGTIWLESSPGEGTIFYFTLVSDTDRT